jgi:hypothetical protein
MKNAVFLNVTPCGCCKNQSFGGTYSLHHWGGRNKQAKNNVSSNCQLKHASKNPDSFHPDDGGDMFLRNACSYTNHTASHPRGRHSLYPMCLPIHHNQLLNVATILHETTYVIHSNWANVSGVPYYSLQTVCVSVTVQYLSYYCKVTTQLNVSLNLILGNGPVNMLT